jgi:hypothetical protein
MEQHKNKVFHIISWAFGAIVFIIGVLNFIFVHPVPAMIAMLLSCIFFPPILQGFKTRFGFTIPAWFKVILGVVIILFTLGVSDLGDIIDDWLK